MQKLNVDFSRHAMGRKCIARFVKHWINSTKQKKSILNICQKTIAIIFQQKCLKMKKINRPNSKGSGYLHLREAHKNQGKYI